MIDALMAMFTAGLYAVFLHHLIFAGGLGATEMVRAAQRNSEIVTMSLMVGLFSAGGAALCRLLTAAPLLSQYNLTALPYAWLAALFGGVLLVLYLAVCGLVAVLPIRYKRLLLKRLGMSGLNTLVMAVPLLMFRLGDNMPRAVGMGLGAGAAFLLASLLVNSGLHILQGNKAIPPMFQGVPAALVYTGLLALAFTGFTGEILFQ